MHFRTITASIVPLAFQLAAAQSDDSSPPGYANRNLPVQKDDEKVSKNFKDVDGIELLSPAFLNPEISPDGWENGTASATPQIHQGMYNEQCPNPSNDRGYTDMLWDQSISCAPWLSAMTG